MSKIDKLVQCLQELQNADYSKPDLARRTNAAAERALNLIFEIGKQRLQIPTAQQKTIGRLLVTAIKPILAQIERTGCIYRTRLDSTTLKKRSAIQFLVDDYAKFPTQNTALSLHKVFEQQNIKESAKILDNIISNWRQESDSEAESDCETDGIPRHHTWWIA